MPPLHHPIWRHYIFYEVPMHFIIVFLLVIIMPSYMCHAAPPAPDLFAGYNKQIHSEADAKNTNIYDAWSNNMENLIRNKIKKGIIVEGAADTDQYRSDGIGNITIKNGAKIGTIINKTTTEDSTIIINTEDSRH